MSPDPIVSPQEEQREYVMCQLWPGTPPGPMATIAPEKLDHWQAYEISHQPGLTFLQRPSTSGPHPAIIVCPGGGYHRRAEHEGNPVAERLATMGVAATVLSYRTSPWRHPSMLWDGVRAVRWLRHHAQELNLDPHRIGILGFSAGGHAAAQVATRFGEVGAIIGDSIDKENGRPDLLIGCYPVLSTLYETHAGSCHNLLGSEATWAERRNASIEEQVGPHTPPTFLWSTDDDQSVPVSNTYGVASRLARFGIPHEVHVYERGGHGMGLGNHPGQENPHAAAWVEALRRWLIRREWLSESL